MPKLKGNSDFGQFKVEHGSELLAPYILRYPRDYVSTVVVQSLRAHEAVLTGPVYNGELEKFILEPLLSTVTKVLSHTHAPGSAIKAMYTRAMNYALITEFLTLTSAKYTALEFTASSLMTQPLYMALESNAAANLNLKTTTGLLSPGAPGAAPLILDYLRKSLPASAIDALNSLSDVTQLTATGTGDPALLSEALAGLEKWIGKGKGQPLTGARRTEAVAQRASVLTAIEMMLDPDNSEQFNDGLAMAATFIQYLQMVKDYDSHAPKMPYQSIPAAWIMALQSYASKSAAFWMAPPKIPYEFDILCAHKALQEQLPIWNPILVGYQDFEEMKRIYASKMDAFLSSASPLTKKWVDEAWTRLKNYTEVDYLVTDLVGVTTPPSMLAKLTEISALMPVPAIKLSYSAGVWKNVDEYPILDAETIEQTKVWTKYAAINWAEGHTVLLALTNTSRAIVMTAEVYNKIMEVGSHAYGDLLSMPPATNWTDFEWKDLPLPGSLKTLTRLGFDKVDPLAKCFTPFAFKSTITNAKPATKWKLKDLMFKPMDYPRVIRILEEPGDNYHMVWPVPQQYPQDDVLTAQFATGVIPFRYTGTRRRKSFPYTMDSWKTLASSPTHNSTMGADSEEKDSIQFFKDATNMLYQLDDEYAARIANALAANFWIYAGHEKSIKWIRPTLPAIFGCPTTWYHQADAHTVGGKTVSMRNITKTELELLVSNALGHKEKFKTSSGEFQVYFILKGKYPSPTKAINTLWSPFKGTYITVPVQASLFSINRVPDPGKGAAQTGPMFSRIAGESTLANPDAINLATEAELGGPPTLVAPWGWSDLKAPWVHITWDTMRVGDNRISDELTWFSHGTISIYQDTYTKELRVRGKTSAEVFILDYDDYQAALAEVDPVLPISSVGIPRASEELTRVNPDAEGGVPANNPGAPTQLGPHSDKSELQAATSVTNIPVPVVDDAGQIAIHDGQGADALPNAPTIVGDPISSSDSVTSAAEGEKDKKKRYYKRLKDDTKTGGGITIETVVELGPDDPIPTGMVPATKAEFEAHV